MAIRRTKADGSGRHSRRACGVVLLHCAVVLFGLGVSGAWIGNFTRLAPYQPYFIVATLGFLGAGYWLVFRASKTVCADGEAVPIRCRTGWSKTALVVATVLVWRRSASISSRRFFSTHEGNTL